MKRTNPSGRTRLLGDRGKPAAEQPPPPVEPRQRSPKPWRAGVPLHHGKHSQAQGEAWDREGLKRREGNDPVPGWQRMMMHGCLGCRVLPGFLPQDPDRARCALEERGWRYGGGMWLCKSCVDEREQN